MKLVYTFTLYGNFIRMCREEEVLVLLVGKKSV